MLTVKTIGRIRREHFLNGKTIKDMASDLRVSRNTVRKVLRSGATSFDYGRRAEPRPKLGRWTLELRGRGYGGDCDAVRRYARRWRKNEGRRRPLLMCR